MSATRPDLPACDLDRDIVRAIYWCRLGRVRPNDEGAFHRAKQLGLLAQDDIWRATPQGEGVLIALGLLDGKPAPRRTFRTVLWAFTDRYRPDFAASWSEYEEDCYGSQTRLNAEEEWRFNFPDEAWRFFTTTEVIDTPTTATAEAALREEAENA